MKNQILKRKVGKKGKRLSAAAALEARFSLREGDLELYPFGNEELYSDEYLCWMNEPAITATIGRFDYLMPVTRKKLVEYFDSLDRETTVFLAIYRKTKTNGKGIFIGTLKVYDIDKLSQRASIGIVIGDRKTWGKGFATTAIKAACDYIFNVLGLRKITAGYLGNNIGMGRAFEKNGFKVEGVLKQQVFLLGAYVDHIFVGKFRDSN